MKVMKPGEAVKHNDMRDTLSKLYLLLKGARGLGTFLSFEISMNGKPTAHYTHGRIDFDDMADVSGWAAKQLEEQTVDAVFKPLE